LLVQGQRKENQTVLHALTEKSNDSTLAQRQAGKQMAGKGRGRERWDKKAKRGELRVPRRAARKNPWTCGGERTIARNGRIWEQSLVPASDVSIDEEGGALKDSFLMCRQQQNPKGGRTGGGRTKSWGKPMQKKNRTSAGGGEVRGIPSVGGIFREVYCGEKGQIHNRGRKAPGRETGYKTPRWEFAHLGRAIEMAPGGLKKGLGGEELQ